MSSTPPTPSQAEHGKLVPDSGTLDKKETTATTTTTTMTPDNNIINACSMKDGAIVLFATDEWFASADHLLLDTEPTFDPTLYCSQGKVMDGWETQRKRQMGYDYCIIQLSQRLTSITSIVIDTAYFTGNQTPYITLLATDLGGNSIMKNPDAAVDFVNAIPHVTRRLLVQMKRQQQRNMGNDDNDDDDKYINVDEYRGTYATQEEIQQVETICQTHGGDWYELLTMEPLRPGYETTRYHQYTISSSSKAATHVRLNYYPDGGIARLRIYGIPDTKYGHNSGTMMVPKQPLYMPMTTCSICTVIPYTDNDDTGIGVNVLNTASSDIMDDMVEVSSCQQGGKGVYCSNQHYGTPDQLLLPSSGFDMSDGWETARQPLRPKILQPLLVVPSNNNSTSTDSSNNSPSTTGLDSQETNGSLVDFGNLMEYCILELGCPISHIQRIVIDTKHFKGNFPESVELSGCFITDGVTIDWANNVFVDVNNHNNNSTTIQWYPIIDRCRLSPHAIHVFDVDQIIYNHAIRNNTENASTTTNNIISHVRVRIFPDGGLSRVRIYTLSSSITTDVVIPAK